MRNLLVVVDMVNGFVNFGALADNKINKITPTIINLIKDAKCKGMDIIGFKDCHSKDDEEFNEYPPHCLAGTLESDLIPELKPYENDMYLINKNTTNGFKTEKFHSIASNIEYYNVYVVGCCTDICVKGFVESYISFNRLAGRQTNVVVIENACYTFDGPNHNAEKMHAKAIHEMREDGAKIVRVNENKKEDIKSESYKEY